MSVQRDCLDELRSIAEECFEILSKYYKKECDEKDLVSSLEYIKRCAIDEYNSNSKILGWHYEDYDLEKELEEDYKDE